MSTFNGVNATKRLAVPSQKLKTQDHHGRMRITHDEFTFSAVLAINETIELMEIPAGAKVYEAEVNSTDLGSVGVLDIGWRAGSDGLEAKDQDGFFAALDVTSAVARQKMTNAVAGFRKTFAERVVVEAKATTATDAVVGLLALTLWYVVD